ncbi:hypothetical protein ACJEBK_28755 [Peribacillus frigoritolerans]|uniref:hypothetical protein n=1 Tax=Peribacillus TaxID=2675229 RepID=UPI00387236CE
MYEDGKGSYQTLAHQLGLRSATQLKQWVKKYRNGEGFDLRGRASSKDTPFIGRPRTHFKSIEEERDYLKAQVDYLKKRNPNLHGEEGL